jgi:hypothetical protein
MLFMDYIVHAHALDEMRKRKISAEHVDQVMQRPDQIIDDPDRDGVVYQGIIVVNGRRYLLRCAVKPLRMLVKTVYYTDNIARYWAKGKRS